MLYNTSCFKKPKGATSGGGTAYPSGAPEFIPVFNGVRVARSLVLYVCVVDCCLSFCTFSCDHCGVCSSSIYGFWLPPFDIFKLFWNHYLHNTKQKTIYKDWATPTPLNSGSVLVCSGRVSCTCCSSATRLIILVSNAMVTEKMTGLRLRQTDHNCLFLSEDTP